MKFVRFNCIALFTAVLFVSRGEKLEHKDIIYTIISQENTRHVERALKLKNEIGKQTNLTTNIYLTHSDFDHLGAWTVLPILPLIWKKHRQKFSWIFFCTDETGVDAIKLKELLENLDFNATFVGRALYDTDATIIHHFFSSPDFRYPLFSSGFVLHKSLIKKLVDVLGDTKVKRTIDFSIDASHELAMFIKENANGSQLTHSPLFCVNYKKSCATYIKNNIICDKQPVDMKKIYFAIKTCHRFHKDRVPVVLKTWAQKLQHITFYSDVYDKKIPTVKLQVPNTEHGHCGKTQAIISDIKRKMDANKDLEWAVLSDDDTLFSTYRLQELLGCYNSNDVIAIGERYGYNVFFNHGYNYLTGGGGVVLSKRAINKFSERICKCPSDSTPDDMFLLGVCLYQLNISIVHIPLFHQARPNDYNEEYLMIGPPISFHKHWMIDPIQVYNEWFQLADILSQVKNVKTEL
ncbi:hypothetical protein RUM44_008473 [Polyplax serrata]|uniref:Fringe-like glycosyltransferase domain-containing protein n=1 Tax=Polyplax serrata TaxID=468196 RepID=A0ABR1B8C4_POLSC